MMNTVSSLFLLHVLFLRIAECQEDVAKGEESSAPAPGGKAGANGASLCDKASKLLRSLFFFYYFSFVENCFSFSLV